MAKIELCITLSVSLQEEFAPYRGSSTGVVARVIVEPSRDIESFPLASLALSGCLLYEYGVARDFVRGADLGV